MDPTAVTVTLMSREDGLWATFSAGGLQWTIDLTAAARGSIASQVIGLTTMAVELGIPVRLQVVSQPGPPPTSV